MLKFNFCRHLLTFPPYFYFMCKIEISCLPVCQYVYVHLACAVPKNDRRGCQTTGTGATFNCEHQAHAGNRTWVTWKSCWAISPAPSQSHLIIEVLVKEQSVGNPAVSRVGIPVDPTRNNGRGDGTVHSLFPFLQSLAQTWCWAGKQPKATLNCTEPEPCHFVSLSSREKGSHRRTWGHSRGVLCQHVPCLARTGRLTFCFVFNP